MKVYLSFDIGITNLAFVKAQVNVEENQIISVLQAECVNISELRHKRVSRESCQLHHSRDVYDKIQHFLQEYAPMFAEVDHILIERQPLGGLVHVEQLLYGQFRSKARLVSPNAMHKHYEINDLNYEGRKEETTRMAAPYLEGVVADWNEKERLHDMADALCLLRYTLFRDHLEWKTQQHYQAKVIEAKVKVNAQEISVENFFEQFRHQKNGGRK